MTSNYTPAEKTDALFAAIEAYVDVKVRQAKDDVRSEISTSDDSCMGFVLSFEEEQNLKEAIRRIFE